jgi:hypothetical protein
MSDQIVTNTPEGEIVSGKICPRCRHEKISLLCKSPVGDVWEMYLCNLCNYSWRSTEIEAIQNPDLYNPKFQLTEEQIDNLMVLPPVPPRDTSS